MSGGSDEFDRENALVQSHERDGAAKVLGKCGDGGDDPRMSHDWKMTQHEQVDVQG
jgi:hypothetical protein